MPRLPKVPAAPSPAWLKATVPPVTYLLPATTRLWRIYKTAGKYPQAWNTFRGVGPVADNRFDHHQPGPAGAPPSASPTGRAIYYASSNTRTAVAEVFQSHRVIDRASLAPELAAGVRTIDLHLLDLRPGSTWPIQAGAAAALGFASASLCQDWSRAIYDAYPGIHGLAYLSTMTGDLAYALFERAQPHFAAHPKFRRRLADRGLHLMLTKIAWGLGGWPIL